MTGVLRKRFGGRRGALAAFLTVTAAAGLAAAATPAQAASLCVGGGYGCYGTIQAAVDAAHNGDTIAVGPGTFAGGITITKSVSLQGAGAWSTTIRGGGSVLTIGRYGAASEPAVSVSGVTITGGVARSSPESIPLFGKAGVWAAGGGIEIPPAAHLADGATVTITDSVITGNQADPTAAVPSGIPCPGSFPQGQCPFAEAFGGGIDSWGALTLIRTAVSHNFAGARPGQPGVASDADGAGIFSREGSLTLDHAVVSANDARAVAPAGRFAEGAGIWAGVPDFGPGASTGRDALVIKDSVIAGNVGTLVSTFPSFTGGNLLDQKANGGGLLVADATPATVDNTVFAKNVTVATDLNGEPSAIDAALIATSGSLTMSNSVISGNRAITRSATAADTGGAGSAMEVDGGGTISHTRITGNYSSMVSPHGAALTGGALAIFGNSSLLTVRDSTISGNVSLAHSSTGSAGINGAAVTNTGLLALVDDELSGNSGTAVGPAGTAQGGAIWSGTDFTDPPVRLTLQHTTVTRNSLTGSAGIKLQGGGVFSAPPATITLKDSRITLNVPDQCVGC